VAHDYGVILIYWVLNSELKVIKFQTGQCIKELVQHWENGYFKENGVTFGYLMGAYNDILYG